MPRILTEARRAFYNRDGPWHRRRLFEAFGSTRYSRPALHGIDRRLEELLPQSGGVFVEAGAHDGFTQSNTYFLERHRGWDGLLVEAVPELHAKAAKRRRVPVVQAALVGPDFANSEVDIYFGDLMSKVNDDGEHARGGLDNVGRAGYSVTVPARTLSDVLDSAGLTRVDLLSLDVEGFELDVLRGIDFGRHQIGALIVEMLDPVAQRPIFDELLADRFDFVEMLSRDDAFYRLC